MGTKRRSMMRVEGVKDLPSFIGNIETFDLLYYQTLFRGQSVRGNLLPSIARPDPSKDTTAEERDLLDQLSKIGATRIPAQTEGIWDLLVLAQHFGMSTRLLDWTSNPLAAMWFACTGEGEGDRYVYALEADPHLLPSISDVDPFDLPETKVVQPRLGNERIVAQHGWFTVHRYSKQSKRFVALEKNGSTQGNLTEYVIPADKRAELLLSLDRCGINQSTLFPDLEGLCRYLSWKHKVNPQRLPKL